MLKDDLFKITRGPINSATKKEDPSYCSGEVFQVLFVEPNSKNQIACKCVFGEMSFLDDKPIRYSFDLSKIKTIRVSQEYLDALLDKS